MLIISLEITMAKKKADGKCCDTKEGGLDNCKVDAIVSIDERGQMVLPKELRKKAGIKPGDKLAVTTWTKDGEVCCIALIKVESLVDLVKSKLGPVMKEFL